MPCSASPARRSALVSMALRGAGPPNRASSACCAAVPSAGRGAPGWGGTSSKSGGTTSGAWRWTANSSGRSRLAMPAEPQAPSEAAPAATRTSWVTLRIRCLRGRVRLLAVLLGGRFLAHEQRAGKDNHHTDRDRRIGDVEDQERPEFAEVEVGEVDRVAVAEAGDDVAERAAEDQPEGQNLAELPFAQHPDQDDRCDQGGQADQRPAHFGRGRRNQVERDAVVVRQGVAESRKQSVLDTYQPDTVQHDVRTYNTPDY